MKYCNLMSKQLEEILNLLSQQNFLLNKQILNLMSQQIEGNIYPDLQNEDIL